MKDEVLEALEYYRLHATPEQKKKDLERLERECQSNVEIVDYPFFLTTEEVEYLKDDLIGKRFCRKLDKIEINLLTRIKQWQDEKDNN